MKNRNKKKSLSGDNFSFADNAFAAAVDQALNDEISICDDTDNIFETIQIHNEAVAATDSNFFSDENEQQTTMHKSSNYPVTMRNASGPPHVADLPDMVNARPSLFKLNSVPILGKKWGNKSERSNLSNSSGERSVYSESNMVKPIPTRRLSRSRPSSWQIESEHEVGFQSNRAAISIIDRKIERVQGMKVIKFLPSDANTKISNKSNSISSQLNNSTHGIVLTRPSLHAKSSEKTNSTSNSYVVPMPIMPYETSRATFVRLVLGILFFCMSAAFAVCFGNGEVGSKMTFYLYNNFIIENGQIIDKIDGETANGSQLFQSIERLENIHAPNLKGKIEYHMPHVEIRGNDIEISIGEKAHAMEGDHFIELIWLRDIEGGEIVLAKGFGPSDKSPATLKARVPNGVTLVPYTFCNLHLLWQGDEFKIL